MASMPQCGPCAVPECGPRCHRAAIAGVLSCAIINCAEPELLDCIEVIVVRSEALAADPSIRLLGKAEAMIPSAYETIIDEEIPSLSYEKKLLIMAIPQKGAGFEFADRAVRSIFSGSEAFVLIDTEKPRASIWRGVGAQRRSCEVTGLDAVIDLPEIDTILPLAELYDGVAFDLA